MLDPESPYVAYCPPGTIDDSRETLDRGGHAYRELSEHQILERSEYIILVDTTEAELPLPPFEHYWWEAAGMKRYLADPLIPRLVTPPSPRTILGSTS